MAIINVETVSGKKNFNIRKIGLTTTIDRERYDGIYFEKGVDVIKHILSTYYPEVMQQVKDKLRSAVKITLETDNQFEDKMFSLISSSESNIGTVMFDSELTDNDLQTRLLKEIDNLMTYWRERSLGKKMCIFIEVYNNCIPQTLGYEIAKMIPLPPEERSIIFNYKKRKVKTDKIKVSSFILNHRF